MGKGAGAGWLRDGAARHAAAAGRPARRWGSERVNERPETEREPGS